MKKTLRIMLTALVLVIGLVIGHGDVLAMDLFNQGAPEQELPPSIVVVSETVDSFTIKIMLDENDIPGKEQYSDRKDEWTIGVPIYNVTWLETDSAWYETSWYQEDQRPMMKRSTNQLWEVTLTLPRGTYGYSFVLMIAETDSGGSVSSWFSDPFNTRRDRGEHGNNLFTF